MITACLAIGGSDSCAGAGIQADLATFREFNIKGCSAITALTAQTPDTISRIEAVSLAQLEAEIRAAFSYYDIRAVKTGMLVDSARIELIADILEELHGNRPLIVDPVMIASSGKRLLDERALDALKHRLFPQATLITPNIPEAEVLLGQAIGDDSRQAARALSEMLQTSVLLKGGHGEGERLGDTLCVNRQITLFEHGKKVWNPEQAHGTGCRLASAVTAGLAQGKTTQLAVNKAVEWLQQV